MGPGESYTGLFGKVRTARLATGQKTLNTGRGLYLRGLADDIMLHHYGVCNICRSFGDAVYVMAPATINLHRQVTVPVPCIITASRVSVTKAIGP